MTPLSRKQLQRAPVYIALAAFALALLVGVPICAVPVLGYLDGTSEQFFTSLAIGYGAVTIAMVVGYVATRRSWDVVLEGLDHPESEAAALAGWQTAISYPRRAILFAGIVTTVLSVPAILVYWIEQFDLNTLEALGAAAGGLTGLAAGCAFQLTLLEFALRPVVAQFAENLPRDAAPAIHRSRVLARIMVVFALLAGTTAIVSGAFIPDSATPATQLAISVGAALGAAAFLAVAGLMMIGAAVETPLRQLGAGTARVADGDYSQPIPPTTADEFGALIASFNRMQEGLAERERLAGENLDLQEQLRKQLEEVQESRARIVSASDAERRRVERNLHDGAQQRLVALALQLSMLADGAENDAQRTAAANAKQELNLALAELRELARGLHPQVLSTGGLKPALEQLAERSPVPVAVEAPPERFPDPVESTVYFVVSEALANVAKYAGASRAEVLAERRNGRLVVTVSDDGVGGADPASGSGLSGLADRVDALNGELVVESPAAGGTSVTVELPLVSQTEDG